MPDLGSAGARASVDRAQATRKKQQTTTHKGWEITSYFGPCLGPAPEDDVQVVDWTAVATNKGRPVPIEPNLEHDRTAIRVDLDAVSVVVFSGRTKSVLTRKLKQAFPGFTWKKT